MPSQEEDESKEEEEVSSATSAEANPDEAAKGGEGALDKAAFF